MPVAGTKPSKFCQYAFYVDFGKGPVYAQRCSLVEQSSGRSSIVIERGLDNDETFAGLMAAQPSSVTVYQADRKRQARVAFVLTAPAVTAYSAGPWNNESSEFAEERVTIEYSGFKRTDYPLSDESTDYAARYAAWQDDVFSRTSIAMKPFSSVTGCRFTLVDTWELARLREKAGETDA